MTGRPIVSAVLVTFAFLLMVASSRASDCVFVAADEASSAVVFHRTGTGTLIFEAWNDVSEDQSLCVYQPGWPVDVYGAGERYLPEDYPNRDEVQARMGERNVFTCEHSNTKGTLTFLSSKPLGPIDIAVIDGHAYYEDCQYGR